MSASLATRTSASSKPWGKLHFLLFLTFPVLQIIFFLYFIFPSFLLSLVPCHLSHSLLASYPASSTVVTVLVNFDQSPCCWIILFIFLSAGSRSGSAFPRRIQIRLLESQINADPQHWRKVYAVACSPNNYLLTAPNRSSSPFLPVLVSWASHRHFNNFGNFLRRLVFALVPTFFFILSHPAKSPCRTLYFVRYSLPCFTPFPIYSF